MTSSTDLRYPFSRQPAHCLLVDLTSQFSQESIHEVTLGISNFFSLVCSMISGPKRIPCFSLQVMTPYTDILLPYQRVVKSCYNRIDSALQEMRKLLDDGSIQTERKLDAKYLEHSIRDATSNFNKVKQNFGSPSKLELTILSCSNSEALRFEIVKALSNVNLTDIAHVTGLSLITCDILEVKFNQEQSYISEGDLACNSPNDLNGIVEVFRIDCDHLSIESIMRNWLNDRNIDREHLHLQFSLPSVEKQQLVIKCDIRERIIDTAELPFQGTFEIGLDTTDPHLHNQPSSKQSEKYSPIITLRIIKRVLTASVCESIIFGKPLLLSCSSCWQMEWDELERNQNHFNVLCRSLNDNKQSLICENITATSAKRASSSKDRPFGLFLLMPAANVDSLLLKSISCSELLLTSQVPVQPRWELVTNSDREDIERALNFVEVESEFNPLLTRSGLFDSLKRTILRDRREPLKKLSSNSNLDIPERKNVKLSSSSYDNCYQFGKQNLATGTATRFVAPRQKFTQLNCDSTANDVPNISLTYKKRKGKTVTFPDFTNF